MNEKLYIKIKVSVEKAFLHEFQNKLIYAELKIGKYSDYFFLNCTNTNSF